MCIRDSVVGRARAQHDRDPGGRDLAAQPLAQLGAVHLGHEQVGDDQVRLPVGEHALERAERAHRPDLEPDLGQHGLCVGERDLAIIDQQQPPTVNTYLHAPGMLPRSSQADRVLWEFCVGKRVDSATHTRSYILYRMDMPKAERDAKKWRAQATEKLLSALNRADELGGELRDYLQDKVVTDPRYVSARKTVARWLGRTYESRDEAAHKAHVKAEKAAAVAAVAPAEQARRGLGDPAIKAQIYGKKSCPWTGRAISLLERHKVDFDFVDLEEPEHCL